MIICSELIDLITLKQISSTKHCNNSCTYSSFLREFVIFLEIYIIILVYMFYHIYLCSIYIYINLSFIFDLVYKGLFYLVLYVYIYIYIHIIYTYIFFLLKQLYVHWHFCVNWEFLNNSNKCCNIFSVVSIVLGKYHRDSDILYQSLYISFLFLLYTHRKKERKEKNGASENVSHKGTRELYPWDSTCLSRSIKTPLSLNHPSCIQKHGKRHSCLISFD